MFHYWPLVHPRSLGYPGKLERGLSMEKKGGRWCDTEGHAGGELRAWSMREYQLRDLKESLDTCLSAHDGYNMGKKSAS